jgi:hypothetical protein
MEVELQQANACEEHGEPAGQRRSYNTEDATETTLVAEKAFKLAPQHVDDLTCEPDHSIRSESPEAVITNATTVNVIDSLQGELRGTIFKIAEVCDHNLLDFVKTDKV